MSSSAAFGLFLLALLSPLMTSGTGLLISLVIASPFLLPPVVYLAFALTRLSRHTTRFDQQMKANQIAADRWLLSLPAGRIAGAPDPLEAAQWTTRQLGGCAFLGLDAATSDWVVAEREAAVLVLGPPRSGKTSSLIVPSILNASGPVVSTSTKPEVMRATAPSRSRMGRIWLFDPSGSESVPAGALELHWSPITQSRTWDGARAMADAMVGASSAGEGVENASHWVESAKSLLAPCLHAAALAGLTISDVRRWISRMDCAKAVTILDEAGAVAAADDLDAIAGRTEERERSSVFSTARLVLSAYGSEAAARRSNAQNFDADKFVRSRDTVYVTAPSHLQTMLAPLVAGLLEEIRDATYMLARSPTYSKFQDHPVLWALDEVANIAPLRNLPAIVSEGGGQNLQVLACLQDLSQARARWGAASEGFLSLFGTKVVFPGIGDRPTLEALSLMVGDWDRPYGAYNAQSGATYSYGGFFGHPESHTVGHSWTYSTQREAQLSAYEISNIPLGNALLVRSSRWSIVRTTAYYQHLPWSVVVANAPSEIQPRGGYDLNPLMPPGSVETDAIERPD